MIAALQKKNPDLRLHDVHDAAFGSYGRVITGMDVTAITAAAKKIGNPAEGSSYVAAEPTFAGLAIAGEIAGELFGQMPTQIGYCWGHSHLLGAVEWHTSSEVNIAITPLILILGHVYDIENNRLDSAKMEAFFVPAGTVIEVYATTLHFCPCEVEAGGFGCVVALPEGTNTPYETTPADKRLFRRNKWLLSHVDNAALIARGAMAGVVGENYEVRY